MEYTDWLRSTLHKRPTVVLDFIRYRSLAGPNQQPLYRVVTKSGGQKLTLNNLQLDVDLVFDLLAQPIILPIRVNTTAWLPGISPPDLLLGSLRTLERRSANYPFPSTPPDQ